MRAIILLLTVTPLTSAHAQSITLLGGEATFTTQSDNSPLDTMTLELELSSEPDFNHTRYRAGQRKELATQILDNVFVDVVVGAAAFYDDGNADKFQLTAFTQLAGGGRIGDVEAYVLFEVHEPLIAHGVSDNQTPILFNGEPLVYVPTGINNRPTVDLLLTPGVHRFDFSQFGRGSRGIRFSLAEGVPEPAAWLLMSLPIVGYIAHRRLARG